LLTSCLIFSCSLPAQGLQLSTANVAPLPANNAVFSGTYSAFLPLGPVAFPTQLSAGLGNTLTLSSNSNPGSSTVSVLTHGIQGPSFSLTYDTASDLETTLSMPMPARITVQITAQVTLQQAMSLALPTLSFGVDLDADGQDEFFSSSLQPLTTSTLTTYCDALGSLVRWHHNVNGQHTGGGFTTTDAQLSLLFENPAQETTYGPTCAGQLGCQLGANTFDRVFVASLPANTTLAWLMGGDQQWNVPFPGFACPLLVDPQFILAVPTFVGPNNRQFVDFAATFPPIPGLTYYAQGIAVSGGTFIGTNAVSIQT